MEKKFVIIISSDNNNKVIILDKCDAKFIHTTFLLKMLPKILTPINGDKSCNELSNKNLVCLIKIFSSMAHKPFFEKGLFNLKIIFMKC